ncbi:hypothetical protein BDW42DRAFT_166808 [Aspergillus taichungensis]|uniref:Uncharacterized protein n=1 Tax=Aspergillus taichungensis TaxID=482145 RepID=A0A2J5HYN8_9EURO|nr:hypothetical protein BDW42DRAFT_166808 [Aspergillus taichungensis]
MLLYVSSPGRDKLSDGPVNLQAPGNHDICVADGDSVELSGEQFVRRIPSHNISTHEIHFTKGVRARDGKCVFTRITNTRNHIRMNKWHGWEACHVMTSPGVLHHTT